MTLPIGERMDVDQNNSDTPNNSVLGKRKTPETRSFEFKATGAIFVPLERNEDTGETKYVSMDEYKTDFETKNGRAATEDDLDKVGVLIQSERGSLLNKPAVFDLFYKGRENEGNFAQDMAKLGLSGKPLNELNEGELEGDDRFLETRSGRRFIRKNFANLEANGLKNPDILVLRADGSYHGFNPDPENKVSYEDLVNNNAKVYLRTPRGNNFIDTETYNADKWERAAEKLYSRYSKQTFRNYREDMPKEFYRAYKLSEENQVVKDKNGVPVKTNEYVSRAVFEKTFGKDQLMKTDILFQSPHGRGLLSGKQYMKADPEGFESFKTTHNLPEDFRFKFNGRTAPKVLIHFNGKLVGKDVIAEAYDKKGMAQPSGRALPDLYGNKEVYVQSQTKNGLTGNFRDADFAKYRRENIGTGRLAQLGVEIPDGQKKLAEVFGKDDLLSNVTPARNQRYEERNDRTREGIGLAA